MKRETIESLICGGLLLLVVAVAMAFFLRSCDGHHAAPTPAATPATPAKNSATPTPAPSIPETYEAAVRQSALTDQPAVLLLSASWCGPCKRFEREILPELKKDNALAPPWLGVIDVDVQADVANQLLQRDKRIPQLIKVDGKFKGETVTVTATDRLIAPRAKAQVEAFLKAKPSGHLRETPPAVEPEPTCDQAPAAMQQRQRFFHRGR